MAADEIGREGKMRFSGVGNITLFCTLILMSGLCGHSAYGFEDIQTAVLSVNASSNSGRKMSDTLFGVFFEVSGSLSGELLKGLIC